MHLNFISIIEHDSMVFVAMEYVSKLETFFSHE